MLLFYYKLIKTMRALVIRSFVDQSAVEKGRRKECHLSSRVMVLKKDADDSRG